MLDSVLAFAGVHPVVAVLLGIPLIGWSARIVIAIVRMVGAGLKAGA